MQEGKLKVEARGDREIVVVREFDAPRQLIWDAYTQPALIQRWLLGPAGWTMPECEVDLRVGGKYRYLWVKDDGSTMAMVGEHREIVPPERLVVTQAFDNNWTGGETLATIELTERDGRTTLTSTIAYPSREIRDGAAGSNMTKGMETSYRRLEALLAVTSEA